MNQATTKLLKLLFNPDETICVSPNKLGYHSVTIRHMLGGEFELTPPPDAFKPEPIQVTTKDIQLVALNPIEGFRRDVNVTKFRSFLVELDSGSLKEQFEYVKSLNMPYSTCIFSGSKSLHYVITLDEDLPDEETYRYIAEWILKIVSKADQMTKNPSRSVRCAGNIRKETGNEMKMLELNKRIPLSDLSFWLNCYPAQDPALDRAARESSSGSLLINDVPAWIWKKLADGIDNSKGRNNEWFKIFISFSKAGYTYDSMVSSLEAYFTPDRDFGRKEWESIAKKAVKSCNRYLTKPAE